MFKVLKLDHIAIAVNNLEESKRIYSELLGMEIRLEEAVFKTEKVKLSLITGGDTDIELLESITPDGPTAKLVAHKGGGIHHIGLLVDNIQNALDDFKTKGVRLLSEDFPRVMPEDGTKIAFIHPKAAGNVLIELIERE